MSFANASRRRSTRAGLAIGAVLAIAAPRAVATAAPVVDVTVRPATFRLVDDEHSWLLFINKARADLCTPERIAFEHEFEAWLDSGAIGAPPQQPASSDQGVKDVTFTKRQVESQTTTEIAGPGLPVEVWSLDNEPGGIDCTATDGPGAKLVASGAMDFSSRRAETAKGFSSDVRARGTVRGTDGRRYSYEVRYFLMQSAGQGSVFRPSVRLVPLG